MNQLLDEKIIKTLNLKGLQSVRHNIYNNTSYCIYITNRFTKIGWLTEISGKYYGTNAKLKLEQKDDIIDYYLAMDENAKRTIDELCKQA